MARPTGLFGPAALTPAGLPANCAGILRHLQWLVEPVSQVLILSGEKRKTRTGSTGL